LVELKDMKLEYYSAALKAVRMAFWKEHLKENQ
jgi:hypothetical protein